MSSTACRPRPSWHAWPSCWSGRTPSSESDRPLAIGKLPPELLRGLVFGRLGTKRSETLIGAALGVDAAAVAFDADWACVLTTDPITTAASGAGRLAVHVVCNDLAAMGAEPLGLLATLLFPGGSAPAAIGQITAEIDATARELNVEVLGGHTEVAPGLTAPIVVMTGVGKARRDRLFTAGGARPVDALVLTKAAGLEGSHILATAGLERAHLATAGLAGARLGAGLAERLRSVPRLMLEEARGYAAELSVVPEARLAVELGATAMHDPTEGGIIGASWEMAEASGCGFRIEVEKIVVRPATRAICIALGVDPLRLIASGALLIACHDGPGMVKGLFDQGIPAAQIGQITESGRQLVHPDGRIEEVNNLDTDEIYRLI